MITPPLGGLYGTIHAGGRAISEGVRSMEEAAERTVDLTSTALAPQDRVTISGDSLEDALVDTMKSKYGIAAGAAVVKTADEALQTVLELFGP